MYLIDSTCDTVTMLPVYPCASQPTLALHSRLRPLPPEKWLCPSGGVSEWVNQSMQSQVTTIVYVDIPKVALNPQARLPEAKRACAGVILYGILGLSVCA